MQHAPAGASLFPWFHATIHGRELCAGPTTAPDSVVWGRSRQYAAMFGEDDREIVSTPSAGRRCRRWWHVNGPHRSLSRRCDRITSDAWTWLSGWQEAEQYYQVLIATHLPTPEGWKAELAWAWRVQITCSRLLFNSGPGGNRTRNLWVTSLIPYATRRAAVM